MVNPRHQTTQGQSESLELPVEYPSTESKHDIKESEGNIFNPIFKGNVQGRKHPERCAFVEPELLSYRKSKHVAQNENSGHKNLNNNNNYHDEIELVQGISRRTHKETQQQRNAHRQNSPINCDGVQLTNEQCHMIPILSILHYRTCWTIQFEYTLETQQERITISYHPTYRHGHTNSWFVYVPWKELVSIT